MGFHATPESLNQIFVAVVLLCTDLHRRLKYNFVAAPFTLFALCDMNEADFLQAWADLETKAGRCQSCIDQELTGILLAQFPALASAADHDKRAARQAVQSLLLDLAVWSPLTSDSVEIKNGQVQWIVSRRSNVNVYSPQPAAEISLVQAAVHQIIGASAR